MYLSVMIDKTLLILIAGPYRSGTDGNPQETV